MHPLLDEFEQSAARDPGRLAACDQSLMLDYRSFRAVASGLAARIAEQANKPHVGIMAPTSSACAAAVFACWYAGKVPVPLNFLLGPAELAGVVADADLDLVLTIEHFKAALAPTGLKTLLLNAQSLAPGRIATPTADLADLAAIIYTSGTSGVPKGVCLTFDNLVQNARACIEHARMDPAQVFLSVIPQFHSFGFTTVTVLPLMLGATVWYLLRFSPVAVVDLIAEKKVTIFVAIASMYGALAKLKKADSDSLKSLRLALSGGEPLSPRVAEAFKARYGIELMEGYGLTESSPVVSVNMPWANCPGSVGRPLPGVSVVAQDDEGNALPAGADGELVVRGHCVMSGYLNKPDETRRVVREGALYTGDVGHVDADGHIHITGRAKDMMIVGGENVFPGEIEAALCDHPAVAEAAVIGMPDDVRGEVPLAYVVLNEGAGADPTELRGYCRDRLAGYKVPREVRIESDLPRGPTGKILKRALKTR